MPNLKKWIKQNRVNLISEKMDILHWSILLLHETRAKSIKSFFAGICMTNKTGWEKFYGLQYQIWYWFCITKNSDWRKLVIMHQKVRLDLKKIIVQILVTISHLKD